MPTTIDVQAKVDAGVITDLDRSKKKYLKREDSTVIRFVSPYLYSYEKNRYFLLKHSTLYKMDVKYQYRPDYLSWDQYGTTTLWALLMYINDIFTIEDFVMDTVLIPSLTSIMEIARLNELDSDEINIDERLEENSPFGKINVYEAKDKSQLVTSGIL